MFVKKFWWLVLDTKSEMFLEVSWQIIQNVLRYLFKENKVEV